MDRPGPYSEEELNQLFEGSEAPIALLMSQYCARQLQWTYRLFPGDLESALIFGQVIVHSIAQHRTHEWIDNANTHGSFATQPLRRTNVTSLADATGIPRETVRRKVQWLLDQEWLERAEDGTLALRPAQDDNQRKTAEVRELLGPLLKVARDVEDLLERKRRQRERESPP